MTKREIVPATADHAAQLDAYIRDADKAEVEALGVTPLDVALRGVRVGSYAFLANGVVVCMFGLETATPFSRVAHPWMLSTHHMEGNKMWFAKASKKLIQHWAEHYDELSNYVDSRYTDAIRWLVWCGFDIVPDAYITEDGISFHRFKMVR